jgi:uncharacterized protein DUF6527
MADKLYFMGDDNRGPRGGKLYEFHCPGCGYAHPFEIECAEKGWRWNGSMDKPTFTPSLRVWESVPEKQCHSVVTEGKITFFDDSFHALKGKTVELPDW